MISKSRDPGGKSIEPDPIELARPFSGASERNRDPILAVLREHFAQRRRVLEVGSGTGQHAVYFSAAMPWLTWQASDRAENLPGIRAWRASSPSPNLPEPVELDVNQPDWPAGPFDAVFSANTLHIMAWPDIEALFAGLPRVLAAEATVVIYGPFRVNGAHTSASNAAFEQRLQAEDPRRAIRDVAEIDGLARAAGLAFVEARAMPANNQCLVWRT